MLRVILIAIIVFVVVRYIRSSFRKVTEPLRRPIQTHQEEIRDKIIPCPTCGTYNPLKDAYLMSGQFYCNVECYNKGRAK